MFKRAKESIWLLKGTGKHIFIFELSYKLATTAVVYPLTILIMNLAMRVAGISYLTNEYIIKALTNPVVIVLFLVTVTAFVIYCVYEMSFLTASFELKRQNSQVSIIETGFTALRKMKALIALKNIPLAFYCFITILTVNVTILGNILFSTSTSNLVKVYILHNSWLVKSAVILVILLIYLAVIPGIYSLNIFFLEDVTFAAAYKKSKSLVKKHAAGTIAALVVYNLMMLAVIGMFYVLISLVLIAGVKILNMAYMGSVIYLSVLKYVRTATKLFLVYIAIPASYTVISRMYYRYADKEEITYAAVRIHDRYFRMNRKIYFAVLFAAILLDFSYAAYSFGKNPFDKVAIFHNTKITAHRGASTEAPENTLAAFSRAIDDMADDIELDVHETKDGAVVVMHDGNAYRTTGVDRNLRDMTLEEVKQLDAGSRFSPDFAGEQVPTLDEVLQLAKGKIEVNIELKTEGNSIELAQKVVDIINQHNMEKECVITSFDYEALKNVKKFDSKIQAGYILSVAYGNFYNMDDLDFFSMNASFLSKRVVDAIHNSGKQVYAWTVDNDTSIRNLTNKGVDNIITDKPVMARETVYSRDTSETLVNMLKYVFNQ